MILRADAMMGALVALVAAIARLPGLGARGLWVDEAFTAIAATRAPAALVELLRTDSGPPLYYLVAGAVAAGFGIGETALRAPSAIAGIASAVVVAAAARRLGAGASGALFAGLFVALSPLLTHHAQDARYYAFLPLLAGTTLLVLERARTRGGSRWWAALALSLAICAYLHTYGLLLVPASAAWLAARGGVRWRAAAPALALPLVAYLPWLPVLADQIAFGGTAWAAREFTLAAPLASLEAFVPGGRTPAHVALPLGAPPILSILTGLALALAALAGAWRERRTRRRMAACVVFSLLPMLLVWLVSALWRPVYVVGRADLLFLPGLLVAVALGLSALGRPATIGASIAVAALGIAALVPYHRADVKSGDRRLARAIEAAATPHRDLVVACGLTYAPLAYYLDETYRGPGGLAPVPFPAAMRHHPGNVDVERVRDDAGEAFAALGHTIGDWATAAGEGARLWAALPPGPLGGALARFLDATLARSGEEEGFRMGMLGTPIRLVAWRPQPQSRSQEEAS